MTSLLLIGCGNMGSALLSRWCEKLGGNFSPITVVEPSDIVTPENVTRVKQISDIENVNPTVVVLAVKPQQLETVLPELAKKISGAPTFLSIAAGKNLAFYEKHLGQGAAIVRAMPNTPALIGEGMTAMVANKHLEESGKSHVTQLMATVGDTLWLADEQLMDAVTAVSGSGPAYFYYMVECLIAAGITNGLTHEQATQLAVTTFVGSAKLASHSAMMVEELRKQVTSPGGTTAAALSVFQDNEQLHTLVETAVAAAIKRAQEL